MYPALAISEENAPKLNLKEESHHFIITVQMIVSSAKQEADS